ncbi:hypothetical protein LDENG_00201110 [Lucifuga dentata]|nr:hypothetical protein LDENG_00201110 [Lucifuga dentata]
MRFCSTNPPDLSGHLVLVCFLFPESEQSMVRQPLVSWLHNSATNFQKISGLLQL